MKFAAPKLVLSVDFADANDLLAGVMTLKGFKVFKSKSSSECLSTISEIKEKVDAVLIDKESAVENGFFLVNQIKKMSDAIVVVIANNADQVEKLLDNNIDEFVLRPTSPESIADKILTMLAKRELKRLKEEA